MSRDSLNVCLVIYVTWYIVFTGLAHGLLFKKHEFSHHPEFQNTVCPSQDIVTTLTLDSGIHCAVTCTRTSTCRTFTYNKDLKECILCRGRYSAISELSSAGGYKFYSDQTRNYHLGCSNDADCNEINNVCESSTGNVKLCVCTPGYSYVPGTMTCVNGCGTYGSTYEMYRQYYLKELNNNEKAGVSLQFCKDFCASRTAYKCLSFERENNKCWFSAHNALTKPNDYKAWTKTTSDFYNRNCA